MKVTFQVRAAGLIVISPRVQLKDGNKLVSPSQLAGALYDQPPGSHPVVCKVSISLRQNGWSAFVVSQAAAVQTRQLCLGPSLCSEGSNTCQHGHKLWEQTKCLVHWQWWVAFQNVKIYGILYFIISIGLLSIILAWWLKTIKIIEQKS